MRPGPGRPAVFLDRDGTLIVDRHYLSDPAGVALLPGAGRGVARLNAAGLFTVLATNQSGIGRGYFTEADYEAVHARLVEVLSRYGARLDAEYHASSLDDTPDPDADRKPGAGMYLRAAREHALELGASFWIGDRLRDVLPALRFGGTPILMRSPETEEAEARALGCHLVDTFPEAVELVLARLKQ